MIWERKAIYAGKLFSTIMNKSWVNRLLLTNSLVLDLIISSTNFCRFQALAGFLLITTRDGKLVYISENVTEYLGHSMVSTNFKCLLNYCSSLSVTGVHLHGATVLCFEYTQICVFIIDTLRACSS